ncbi:hypothetical protein F5880DRAFT_1511055 [Lentinula raphanica]|nr:hypothetical protein F5880DRAFT_1511055 [Lentinula raphanica]
MPQKSTGRKQGNQGHFHGEPLELLESFAQAYIDAGMNKSLFWKDFWLAWYKEYPPLTHNASNSASSANDASALDISASSSAANDTSSAANDASPVANNTSPVANDTLPIANDTSTNAASASAEVASIEDQDVLNARTASEKFFMHLPQYSGEVEARYRAQFVKEGVVQDPEENEEEEVDQLDEDEDVGDKEKEKDDGEGGDGDEDREREKKLALS